MSIVQCTTLGEASEIPLNLRFFCVNVPTWQHLAKDATNIYRYNIRIRVHVQSYFAALWCAPFGLLFLILLSKLAGPTIANKTKFQADSEFQGPKFVVYGCQTSVGLIPPNDLKVSKKLDRQMS